MGWFDGEKQRFEMWRAVATDRGGVIHEGENSLWRAHACSIEVDYGGEMVSPARLFMDILSDSSGKSGVEYTRVRALTAVPAAPKFKVYREYLLSKIGKRLGTQDVVLGGHAKFDELFMVKTKDPDRTRRMWTARAKAAFAEHLARAAIASDRETLEIYLLGIPDKREVLEAMLDVVGELASADIFGLTAISGLRDATYHPPSGPWDDRSAPHAEVSTFVSTIVGPIAVEKRAVTRAVTEQCRDDYECVVEIDSDGSATGTDTRLPDAARSALVRVGSSKLTVAEGRAELIWASIEENSERLQAGVDLVSTFATASRQGAFR